MSPWLETLGVVGLGGLGVLAGRCFSRLRRPWWALGYLIPMAFVAAFVAVACARRLEFYWPFQWLTAGRREFALLALAGAMVLTTPLSRLPRRPNKQQGHILTLNIALARTGRATSRAVPEARLGFEEMFNVKM